MLITVTAKGLIIQTVKWAYTDGFTTCKHSHLMIREDLILINNLRVQKVTRAVI